MLYLSYQKAYSLLQVMPVAYADIEHPAKERILEQINFFFFLNASVFVDQLKHISNAGSTLQGTNAGCLIFSLKFILLSFILTFML